MGLNGTYLIQHLPNHYGPEPVPSGPIPSSRPTGYSPAAIELMGFKKGIKREIAAYRPLKMKGTLMASRGAYS